MIQMMMTANILNANDSALYSFMVELGRRSPLHDARECRSTPTCIP